jgi:hypothetical protein
VITIHALKKYPTAKGTLRRYHFKAEFQNILTPDTTIPVPALERLKDSKYEFSPPHAVGRIRLDNLTTSWET